ncbi:MAG: hypothetical protein IH859_02415 [Chloroflexi bacterium]|nr:hypothetical protein [Chloroflexota bacterium]
MDSADMKQNTEEAPSLTDLEAHFRALLPVASYEAAWINPFGETRRGREYTVMGDKVHTDALLMHKAERGQILFSKDKLDT